MAISPFPSQDLAKLVLGYLAEEQLMTAYDEFLQASPYLDVFRNEYDRIFMTSLKNILAEYRAVKIYVETCKPHLLRKKLFQCSNLLEVVKLLVNYVDLNRLHSQDCVPEKISLKQSLPKNNGCDVCNSLNLNICACKKTDKSVSITQPSQLDCPMGCSTETTALEDLPGNSVNVTNKIIRCEEKDKRLETLKANEIEIGVNSSSGSSSSVGSHMAIFAAPQEKPINVNTLDAYTASLNGPQTNTLSLYNINNEIDRLNRQEQRDGSIKDISNTGSFQEFAFGVSGNKDTERPIVPDSSTSENCSVQIAITREKETNINPITNIKGPPKTIQKMSTPLQKEMRNQKYINIKAKSDDQRIKIISDVKLDDTVRNRMSTVPPLQPISSPLVQMQKIVINGTPAFSYAQNKVYNREEIMAMPTIILVPSSGPENKIVQPMTCSNLNVNMLIEKQKHSLKPLMPLTVDVPPKNSSNSVSECSKIEVVEVDEPTIVPSAKSIFKTVDLTHNSLPKNTTMATSSKISTPNILPPTRKSSSTPRRTSHVRVLDFTTPRRILHETINEQEPTGDKPDEVIDLDNIDGPNATKCDRLTTDNKQSSESSKLENSQEIHILSMKENNSVKLKRNWDTELRQLAVRNDGSIGGIPISKHKRKKASKKKIHEKERREAEEIDSSCKKKKPPKCKKIKTNIKSFDIKEPAVTVVRKDETAKVVQIEAPSIDSTVNISTSDLKCVGIVDKDNGDNQPKNNISEEKIETPEAERLSLQNVIGAKLNISDLLETPYKQALYDIQMETPKFLGPDLPGEPVSDIKIMNIPTPRFFDTPQQVQATPSSYSSRPTDYSSGGSYYKPDDQEFVPDVLKYAVTVKENSKEEAVLDDTEIIQKPCRPQRKCTRNVSYRSPLVRSKDDSSNAFRPSGSLSLREKKTKISESKTKAKQKSISKKKVITVKSPFRRESLNLNSSPNKYIKVKPFRATLLEETSKEKKNTPKQMAVSKSLSRSKRSDKEKNTNGKLLALAAPPKSRRKSSTPRKLDTNTYQDNIDNTSSDQSKSDQDIARECPQDSDIEQPLRWSEDRSEDTKKAESKVSDEDEIKKIKEYIESTVTADSGGHLHCHLVKRGFDLDTAKMIERDLLETNSIQDTSVQSTSIGFDFKNPKNVGHNLESDCGRDNLKIVQDDDVEEVELSNYDCIEESDNFVTVKFDDTKFLQNTNIAKLKETFSMEVCIDDESIRLRSTHFKTLLDEEPTLFNHEETEAAVNSISGIRNLYTPMKSRRAQCKEIFDSTLTSIDTPIKTDKEMYETVTEIVLEVESIDVKDKAETKEKKRKRLTSDAEESTSTSKKNKPDPQYLLNSANIQNIDIESVLSKLHGP